MALSFNNIPLLVNTPGSYIEFDSSRAVSGLQIQPHEALLVGNMTSSGTATANEPVFVKSYESAVGLFGANSQLANMTKAYKDMDRKTPLWAIPLDDDSGGTACVKRWTITGTASSDGEIPFYIDGRRFAVSVSSGDANTAIVTAAVTAGNLLTNRTFTVSDSGTGYLDATNPHKGAFGSQSQIGYALLPGEMEKMPAGITVATSEQTAGAGDADHDDAVTGMDETQYNTIVLGVYTAAEIAKIVTELEDREGPTRQIEGVAFAAVLDSQADITTYSANFNSHILVMVGAEENALLPAPWELAAQAAAMNAYRTQVDPARNLAGHSFYGLSAPARGSRFTREERDTLIEDGISTTKAGSDGRLLIERFVTTRIENSQSLADLALQDLTTVRALHAMRYTVRARISSKFSEFKLADDGTTPRPKVVTPSVIRGELLALGREWEDSGWLENFDQFEEDLIVERNGSDVNRIDAQLSPDIINQFYVFAAQIQFLR